MEKNYVYRDKEDIQKRMDTIERYGRYLDFISLHPTLIGPNEEDLAKILIEWDEILSPSGNRCKIIPSGGID